MNIFQGISVFHQPDRFVFSFTLLTNPWILWTPNVFCFLLLHTVIHDVNSVRPSPSIICFLFVVQKTVKTVNPNICISPPAVPECARTQLGKGGGAPGPKQPAPKVKMLLWPIYDYWQDPHTNKNACRILHFLVSSAIIWAKYQTKATE